MKQPPSFRHRNVAFSILLSMYFFSIQSVLHVQTGLHQRLQSVGKFLCLCHLCLQPV